MPAFTVSRPDLFPSGTTVNAYPASNWPQASLPPSGAPLGASAGSAVATDTGVTIAGLVEDAIYYAYAQVGGVDRYVRFKVDTVRTALDALSRDLGQAGEYAVPPGASQSNYTCVANQGRITRWTPAEDRLIRAIGFATVTAAGADDACSVAILSAAMARLGVSAATSGKLNVVGAKSVSLLVPVQVQAGVPLYLGFSNGPLGGTAGAIQGLTYATPGAGEIFGTAGGQYEFGTMAAAHPLPDPFVRASAGSGPLLAALE